MSSTARGPCGEVLVYEAADGEIHVDVRLDHETVWLTQEQMSQLFGRERSVITKHVRNVFREGSWRPGQYVQNLHILPKTEKRIRSTSTTLM